MTPAEAIDAIGAVFKAAWDPTGAVAVYDDLPQNIPPDEKAWARLTVRHNDGGQSSLAGGNGAQRWEAVGVVTVQIFTPVGDGLVAARALSLSVLNAFRDHKNSDLWFRRPHLRELGVDGAFNQTNVIATFIYDEVR